MVNVESLKEGMRLVCDGGMIGKERDFMRCEVLRAVSGEHVKIRRAHYTTLAWSRHRHVPHPPR